MRPGAGDRRAAVAAVLAAIAVLAGGPAAAAGDQPGIEVRDLYYGEVLFHFYQQQDFTALTHLLAARHSGRASHHDADSELLLGGLYLAYGQHDQASTIFTRLLDESVDPAVRDRAWFYLGKVRFQRSLFAPAEEAFRQVGDKLPRPLAAERGVLLAQSLMGQGRYDEAAAVLDDWKGPDDWTAYARYNLGVAYVREQRLEDGARELDRVGRMRASAEELLALRDKANLALGYAWLQAERPAEARLALERVQVNGPFSNKALLGAGWADALQGQYRRALGPWMELRDRDLLDSAVQESMLAVPYAFGRLEAHGSAVDHYVDALTAFDDEILRLDRAIVRARDGDLVPALLQSDDPDIGRWYWQLDGLPDSDDARYLYHIVADHQFQDGLRNYRDLQSLHRYLQEWQTRLDAFDDMIDTRAQAYAERVPVVDQQLNGMDLDAIHARRDALATQLAEIEATRDIAGLASELERSQWQLLIELEQSPAWSDPAAAEERERQRILKGLMQWNFDQDFNYRLWQQRRSLDELDTLLVAADAASSETRQARDGIPVELEEYRNRIAALRPRLAALQAQLGTALGEQQQNLQLRAARELEAQRERLGTYRVQARFALATIYDRANATASAGESPR